MTADLAALVGSRIAHDLASPLGAIANGIELLGLTGAPDSPELALISESVDAPNARIKAFRIAFGAAAPDQVVKAADVAALLAPRPERKTSIDWRGTEGDVPRPAVKLVMLALMCCETAMPRGGQVRIEPDGDGWQIHASAERLSLEPALWATLTGDPNGAIAPAQVQFALLALETRAQSRRLSVAFGETEIRIRV